MSTQLSKNKLSIEQHQKQQPFTPEQTHDAGKKRAVVQTNLPVATKAHDGTALTVLDNRPAYERLADEVAPSFMPGAAIKFDGKEGKFLFAASDEPIEPMTRYIARVPDMWDGYIRFNGEGRPPDRFGGLPYDGQLKPPRESLGDTNEADWPVSDLTGKPQDPLQHQMLMPLQNAETLEIFVFQTTSVTGRTAVGSLMKNYNRLRKSHPGEVPVVQLRPSSYPHRIYGKVNIPSFVVVGHVSLDDDSKPDSSLEADLNDAIDF